MISKIEVLGGMNIDDVCVATYDRALHGEALYFDFNDVRISMYPLSKQ